MNKVFRIFSGLLPSQQGPGVRSERGVWQQVFLRQSHIDGACGQHCLFMALLMLGVFGREEVLGTKRRKSWLLGHVERRSQSYHFDGTTVRSLRHIVAPLRKTLVCEYTNTADNAIRDFSLSQLQKGRLVVVGLRNHEKGMWHWVLAIGAAGEDKNERFIPTHLLLLDPNVDVPPGSLWNSTVTVNALSRGGRFRLVANSYGEETKAVFSGAVAIGLKNTGRNDHY
jgi:hypothetical protein